MYETLCYSIADKWASSKMYTNDVYFRSTASSLHQRKCPNSGRYKILDFAPSHALSATVSRRQQRSELSRTTKRRTWQENIEDVQCRSMDIQVGCTSFDQAEIIIGNTCEHEKIGKHE